MILIKAPGTQEVQQLSQHVEAGEEVGAQTQRENAAVDQKQPVEPADGSRSRKGSLCRFGDSVVLLHPDSEVLLGSGYIS